MQKCAAQESAQSSLEKKRIAAVIGLPKPHPVDRSAFKTPTEQDRMEVEKYLADLKLIPSTFDRIACSLTGSYLFLGKRREHQIASYRHFAFAWALQNQPKLERLTFCDQEQLTPEPNHFQGDFSESFSTRLDRLVVESPSLESTFHESIGQLRFPPSDRSALSTPLRNCGVFFPTRAVISHPSNCWSGDAWDRNQSSVSAKQLEGVQWIGEDLLTLFEFKPAPFYRFYFTIYFKKGVPVQCDSWRCQAIPNPQQQPSATDQPIPSKTFSIATSICVATTRSDWIPMGPTFVPVAIRSKTINDVHEIELKTQIKWHGDSQIDPVVFQVDPVIEISPMEFSRTVKQ